jgi:hypothetical protein
VTRHQRFRRIQRLFYRWQSACIRTPYQAYGAAGSLIDALNEFEQIHGGRLRAYWPKESNR